MQCLPLLLLLVVDKQRQPSTEPSTLQFYEIKRALGTAAIAAQAVEHEAGNQTGRVERTVLCVVCWVEHSLQTIISASFSIKVNELNECILLLQHCAGREQSARTIRKEERHSTATTTTKTQTAATQHWQSSLSGEQLTRQPASTQSAQNIIIYCVHITKKCNDKLA